MKPAAWVRNLTDPQPHCVTDLKYVSAADVDAGVQYVPLYTKREWVGLTDEQKKMAYALYGTMTAEGFVKSLETKLREKNT